ncbi:DNA translocase FtsK [Arsenicitalea aurantiaca]|uniref:DNA translocase FtsK n=1 Tax=Arsenicitalea aurantiaca TaxID=1783274 RepID=A0A433X7V5_9HYPH|nr:DNA translocase FtsK [Arsenicitalea aurantiaca]RUT30133.1 DNA translocase FtsK [Arsenicitalea aurantiaca]
MPTQNLTDDLTRPAHAIAIRIPVRLVGFMLLGLVGFCMLALATWSVDDPSLSYATVKAPENWLGFPGAVVADLLFQVFGLSVLVLLVPPALWAWKFMRLVVPARMGLRVLAWAGASLMAAGVLAFLAIPSTWPLPTGLGGLVGQGFANLGLLVTGEEPQPVTAILFAVILAVPALALFWVAAGTGTPARTRKKASRAENARARMTEETDEDGGNDRPRVLDIALGAMAHMGYSARTALRRARAGIAARRAAGAEDEAWRGGAVEPALSGHAGMQDGRREPGFGTQKRIAPVPAPAPVHGGHAGHEDFDEPPFDAPLDDYAEAYVEDVDFSDDPFPEEDEPVHAPAPVRAAPRPGIQHGQGMQGDSRFQPARRGGTPAVAPVAAPSARVAAPVARPVPSQRATREAQGSLLEDPFGFELPPLSLLAEPRQNGVMEEHRPERLEAMARRLEGVLEDFGVKGDIINVRPGPVVTLYELEPAPGIKSSRVISLADDIARSMSAISARVAVVPGRNAIGIELPNKTRETVFLREMLASADFEKMKGKLPICLGKTIGGEPIIVDLARMPHLLIAGTTGSGKSVGINTMILSLLYRMSPEQCRLIMIDPKMLELSIYDGIPHLLTPVVTDPSKAVVALKWAVREMEDRYRKMSKIGVRNIDGFNQRVGEAKKKGEVITRTVQTGFDRETGEAIFESEEFDLEPLPFIVVIVDEMADLMMVAGKDIEGTIQRLAQMARAAGIHIIMATQRPSVDVITGTIKANFPTRVSFQVTSKIDSRTILGEQGAEQLLGNGDMLYMAGGGRIRRLHGPFVADNEVESVVAHLKAQGAPDYLDSITSEDDDGDAPFGEEADGFGGSGDELYDKAVNIVLQDKKASTSYIQRRLAIGYNRAATLIERMEQEGVISPANHAGKREILVGGDQEY